MVLAGRQVGMPSATRRLVVAAVAGALLVCGVIAVRSVRAPAASHPTGSVSVAFVGSNVSTNGGALNHSDPAFSSMTFSDLAPASVTAAGLAPFDTVVLNVASLAMACNVNTLSASSKSALVTWLGAGNKLIIWDSECAAQDYSWLPFP